MAVAKVKAKQQQQQLTKNVNYQLLEEILDGIKTAVDDPAEVNFSNSTDTYVFVPPGIIIHTDYIAGRGIHSV
ncbi:MAG: hypothetical protein ACRD5B_14095 [Nitrososphaeraceae archaeon]